MTLTRVWTPSGNYSGGSVKRLIVLHSTEGFTGTNGAYDCAKYFQTDCGASSQVCIDNNRGKVWECVNRSYGSWTQCNYNSVSVSAEQCGYASWSRDYWLSNRSNELHNAADWIAEESLKFGIPIVALSEGQAQGGGRGVCYHSHLGSSGCGHGDPGSGYPLDQVLEWAKGGGGSQPSPIPEVDVGVSVSVAFDRDNQAWYAAIGTDGGVFHQAPGGGGWRRCDDGQSGAKSGAGIAVDPDNRVVVSYTNSSGAACTYTRNPADGSWSWQSLGGNVR
jgi:hypothetical protein